MNPAGLRYTARGEFFLCIARVSTPEQKCIGGPEQ